MHGEHPHSQQVGLTQMVDEAADVAKESCVNTVHISHLHKMMSKKCHSHMLFLGLLVDTPLSSGLETIKNNLIIQLGCYFYRKLIYFLGLLDSHIGFFISENMFHKKFKNNFL